MGYIGKSNVDYFAIQEQGAQPTLQELLALFLQSLTVSSGAVLPAFDVLYVNNTGVSLLGTVTSGIWNGSVIDEAYGGTGKSSYSVGDLLYADGVGSLATLPSGNEGQRLEIEQGSVQWTDPSNVPPSVVTVTSALYYASTNDRFVVVSGMGEVTVGLPTSPFVGEQHTVKDQQGIAASSGITVDGSGNLIDGASTSVISGDYGALSIVWDGAQWSIY